MNIYNEVPQIYPQIFNNRLQRAARLSSLTCRILQGREFPNNTIPHRRQNSERNRFGICCQSNILQYTHKVHTSLMNSLPKVQAQVNHAQMKVTRLMEHIVVRREIVGPVGLEMKRRFYRTMCATFRV